MGPRCPPGLPRRRRLRLCATRGVRRVAGQVTRAVREDAGARARVTLTAEDRELWAPRAPDRSAVPVLLYRAMAPQPFATQMVLIEHAGYETITLGQFVRFIRGDEVSLPPRPLLLTFDGGRADSWTGTDAILRKLGFTAAIFVDLGRVDAKDHREYLTWKELEALQRSGRW